MAITQAQIEKIERDAQTASIAVMAAFLQEVLGQKITAYLSGRKDAKLVGMWAAGKVTPGHEVRMRLQYAYHAARMIDAAYGKDTMQSWFFGSNTRLDDAAPAYVLRHSRELDDIRLIVPAARAFVGAAA